MPANARGRPATGQIQTTKLADGTRAFQLRFRAEGRRQRVTLHERRDCECGCAGGWTERTAAVELDNILARVKAGVWRKQPALDLVQDEIPTFHEYASMWLEAKVEGTIGDRAIDRNTQSDYRWRLSKHLLPFFARYRLDEIDGDVCQAFKAAKLREAGEIREALAAGAVLRDQRGRGVQPLGPSSVRKLIDCLASILDEAVEDGYIDRNPARSRRMRIRVPKPRRTFLEMDELVALMDAAAQLDAPPPAPDSERLQGTAARVVEQLEAGRRPMEIAETLGLARSTVSYHLRRLGTEAPQPYVGRRAVIATLGWAGLRASELCDLRMRDVRLHEQRGGRLHVLDAKTEAGVREVQLSPDLARELAEHVKRLAAAGMSTAPDAYMFPNLRGGRMSRQRVAAVVREAATVASENLVERGLPPLPTTTPHSLRRTYISIALLANGFDVLWVMSQVGHADSKMTTDVYAQLQHRARRDHGEAFDGLVRRARGRSDHGLGID